MKKKLLVVALLGACASAHAAWVTTDLGSLGEYGSTRALGIGGHVAGESIPVSGGPMFAFRTGPDGMQLLSGIPGSVYTSGAAVNGAGDVVGQTAKPDLTYSGFVYSHGVMTELTLGGSNAEANHINHIGQVIGSSATPGDAAQQGFLYSRGVMTPLSMGGALTIPSGINASGQVAGYGIVGNDYEQTRAFLYSKGVMTDLGTLPGGTIAASSAINDAGQIAGYASVSATPTYHAFRYDNGVMTDLGTLGGPNSFAVSINGAGLVIGYSDTANGGGYNKYHAFVSDGQQMTDLGTLGGAWSFASGINGAGQIVGSTALANGKEVPFLYENGAMHNVAELVTGFDQVSSYIQLNELGQIAGTGLLDGKPHAFLLTWVPDGGSQGGTPATASMTLTTASKTETAAGNTRQPVTTGKSGKLTALEAMMAKRGLQCPPPYCTAPARKK